MFVEEQRSSTVDDLDEHDDDPAMIKVLGLRGREPAGAVRLYPLDADGVRGRATGWRSSRRYRATPPARRSSASPSAPPASWAAS